MYTILSYLFFIYDGMYKIRVGGGGGRGLLKGYVEEDFLSLGFN